MIKIDQESLDKAWEKGPINYIQFITDKYTQFLGSQITAENIDLLNAEQHTLNAYKILLDEVMVGGFIQLIQNGYAPYILDGPFPYMIKKMWGFKDFGNFLYKVKNEYHKHKEELTADLSDEDFMALYEQYDSMNELGDAFLDDYQEEITPQIALYVRNHELNFL